MTGHLQEPWITDFFVFLVAAGLIVPLFNRVGVGAVLVFLLVGIIVGPFGLGRLQYDYHWIIYITVESEDRVQPFAELGVIFLLFLIGIELSIARLWGLRRYVFGTGGAQFLMTSAVIAGLAGLFGAAMGSALVLGVAIAMSSTAVALQLLEEQGRLTTPLGRIAMAVLLFQDLMVAPVLFGVSVLGSGDDSILSLIYALAQAALVVVAIVVVGRYALRPIFRYVAKSGNREVIIAVTILMVVGTAALTGLAGMSTALGAFLAGLLLSETEYRPQIEIDLAPFKGLLLGVFFMTVGMTIDVIQIWDDLFTVLGALIALLAIKTAILYAVCRLTKVPAGVALEAAILMSQAGEFAFVVIALAQESKLLERSDAQFVSAVVGLSIMATPLLAVLGRKLARGLLEREHNLHLPTGSEELDDHVVIGGFGRVGQIVGRALKEENISFVALDTNGELVMHHRANNESVFFGDAGRVELLEKIGADRARAFVVTVNSPVAAERMVAAARKVKPDVPIFARASDAANAGRLLRLGAVGVIPEAVESSLKLSERVLEAVGLSGTAVAYRISQVREQELAAIDAEPSKTV